MKCRGHCFGLAFAALLSAVVVADEDQSWLRQMSDWTIDQYRAHSREDRLKGWFGEEAGGTVNDTVEFAKTYHDLLGHETTAFTDGMKAFSEPDPDKSQAQWQVVDQKFDEQLHNDVWNMVVPAPLSDLIPHAEKLYETLGPKIDAIVDKATQLYNKASDTVERLKSYLGADADYGLETGSPDTVVARTAISERDLSLDADQVQGSTGTEHQSLNDLLAQAHGSSDGPPQSALRQPDAVDRDAASPMSTDHPAADPPPTAQSAVPQGESGPSDSEAKVGHVPASNSGSNGKDLLADLQSAGWVDNSSETESSKSKGDEHVQSSMSQSPAKGETGGIDANALSADLSAWDHDQATKQQTLEQARARERTRQEGVAQQQQFARQQDATPPTEAADATAESGRSESDDCAAEVQPRVQAILQQCANSAPGDTCGLTTHMARCADRARAAAGSCAIIASQALGFCLQNKRTAQQICADGNMVANLCSGAALNSDNSNSSSSYYSAADAGGGIAAGTRNSLPNPYFNLMNAQRTLEEKIRQQRALQNSTPAPNSKTDPNAWFNGTQPKSH
jgi:hypothetical protein